MNLDFASSPGYIISTSAGKLIHLLQQTGINSTLVEQSFQLTQLNIEGLVISNLAKVTISSSQVNIIANNIRLVHIAYRACRRIDNAVLQSIKQLIFIPAILIKSVLTCSRSFMRQLLVVCQPLADVSLLLERTLLTCCISIALAAYISVNLSSLIILVSFLRLSIFSKGLVVSRQCSFVFRCIAIVLSANGFIQSSLLSIHFLASSIVAVIITSKVGSKLLTSIDKLSRRSVTLSLILIAVAKNIVRLSLVGQIRNLLIVLFLFLFSKRLITQDTLILPLLNALILTGSIGLVLRQSIYKATVGLQMNITGLSLNMFQLHSLGTFLLSPDITGFSKQLCIIANLDDMSTAILAYAGCRLQEQLAASSEIRSFCLRTIAACRASQSITGQAFRPLAIEHLALNIKNDIAGRSNVFQIYVTSADACQGIKLDVIILCRSSLSIQIQSFRYALLYNLNIFTSIQLQVITENRLLVQRIAKAISQNRAFVARNRYIVGTDVAAEQNIAAAIYIQAAALSLANKLDTNFIVGLQTKIVGGHHTLSFLPGSRNLLAPQASQAFLLRSSNTIRNFSFINPITVNVLQIIRIARICSRQNIITAVIFSPEKKLASAILALLTLVAAFKGNLINAAVLAAFTTSYANVITLNGALVDYRGLFFLLAV